MGQSGVRQMIGGLLWPLRGASTNAQGFPNRAIEFNREIAAAACATGILSLSGAFVLGSVTTVFQKFGLLGQPFPNVAGTSLTALTTPPSAAAPGARRQ